MATNTQQSSDSTTSSSELSQPHSTVPEPATPTPVATDRPIAHVRIHPAIGVARVGNSEKDYFIGPQVTKTMQRPPGFYRDERGALKRQAAEFRIYACDADGEIIGELTAAQAEIHWSVHLANHKASWYQWQMALDIPEAATLASPLRNGACVTDAQRQTLQIDGGEQRVHGKNVPGVAFTGMFQTEQVYLGEIRTDECGRLLVLPGFGKCGSPGEKLLFVRTDPNPFGNADGWYDDIADGPVKATVAIGGRTYEAEPAWVVTAPPNYAPQIKGVRTLHDVLQDLFVGAGWLPEPAAVSFRRDVYPVLERLSGLQWVNEGFAIQFGHQGRYDFGNPAFAARLSGKPGSDLTTPEAELRRQIFNSFRPPNPDDANQLSWPWLYGDAMDLPTSKSPRQNATLSSLQYRTLSRWARGDFEDDWNVAVDEPTDISEVPLVEQPAMLDRAALDFCLADAFHPGCEMTWPMRQLSLYSKPFRVRHEAGGPAAGPTPPALTQASVLLPGGPLLEQGPGGLTRWMAVPWHADTAWCRSGYVHDYDPFVPSFWPARVPNQVLVEADYAVAIDTLLPDETRLEAFERRSNWNAPLGEDILGAMQRMVQVFGSMGLVEARVSDPPNGLLPPIVHVATYGPDIAAAAPVGADEDSPAEPMPEQLEVVARSLATSAAAATSARTEMSANFSSQAAADAAPRPVRHARN